MNLSPSEQMTPAKVQKLTLELAREQLKKARGRQYWRSLEQLSRRDDFGALMEQEFPRQAAGMDTVGRRDFLRLMGASLALGGLTACTRQPNELIVPYVKPPEDMVPGKPLFFATNMSLGGYGLGMLVESHMGRPTKTEGNPNHPSSLGASGVFCQSSVWTMYDPDRSQSVLSRGRTSGWNQFVLELEAALQGVASTNGAGLRVLTETVTSPTLAAQLKDLLAKYPQAKWIQYEPVNRDKARFATKLAFDAVVDPVYHLDKAKVIVSIDADFLAFGPGHIRYTHDFAAGRNVTGDAKTLEMNRLYAIETGLTVTGAAADHRVPVAPSQVEGMVRAIARGVGIETAAGELHGHEALVAALVKDLKAHRGAAVLVAGEHLPPYVQALVFAINDMLDAAGRTVTYHAPVEAEPALQTEGLKGLVEDMKAGKVEALFVLGGNPVYYAPADLKFAEAYAAVKFRVHLGLYADETARLSLWHIPEAHFLEGWSDVRSFDGTAGIVQPLIEPLYQGKSQHEMVAAVLGRSARKGYEIVRDFWKTQLTTGDGELAWRKALHDGFVAGTAAPAKEVKLAKAFLATAPEHEAVKGLELVFQPDNTAYDGRFTNNAWLQELPRPTTKLVWDNALLVGPKTAAAKGWATKDLVHLATAAGSVQVVVCVTPGIAENVAVLSLGYGRTAGGRNLPDCGFNAYAVRASAQPWFTVAEATKTGDTYNVVSTQEQHEMPLLNDPQETSLADFADKPDFIHRHHARSSTLEEYKKHPEQLEHLEESIRDEKTGKAISIYADFDYSKGNQWGMVINLSACIGCNACMIACVAENNISVVGKDQCYRNRDMHWIRVDRYFSGDRNDPRISYQPVPCQHCENAPCEAVCPVAATVHSRDGINQMVYNRCVGTRYCSNNCPYKVRRFNFYKFADHETPSFKLMRNPDVTVRSRGVMEKCTYCTQRISEARIEAKKQYRDVLPGEVVTACQQACPTRAITFGDINNAQDPISRLRKSPLHYGLFEELATRPRTTYLARVRNPNPELEAHAPATDHTEQKHV